MTVLNILLAIAWTAAAVATHGFWRWVFALFAVGNAAFAVWNLPAVHEAVAHRLDGDFR